MLNPLHVNNTIRLALAALVVIFLALSVPTAMAQEQSDARKLTDPTAPGFEEPMANYDPWEGMNRSIYKFNYGFDKYVFLPVVKAYEFILPDVVQTGIANFFHNLYEITNVYNNLLQGNAEGTVNSSFRIVFNTTIGLAGILDPATPMGYPKMKEDFGQTLGVWGVGPGPYLVLPFLGPSSLRDGIGTGVDAVASSRLGERLCRSDEVYSDRRVMGKISTGA